MHGCLSCKLDSNSANSISKAMVDFSHFAFRGGTASFESRWCGAAEPSEDFHRRVHTSCDLEDVPRAGEVSFSVADAKGMM